MAWDIIYPSSSDNEKPYTAPPEYESNGSLQTITMGDLTGLKDDKHKENPHADGYFDPNGKYIRNHGLNWVITGLFVVGDLAGGGLVALPTAMIQSGFWAGMIGIIIMTFVAGYTSYALGRSWMILLK
jgi:hypothetical protein